jgi:hypothetical protein
MKTWRSILKLEQVIKKTEEGRTDTCGIFIMKQGKEE